MSEIVIIGFYLISYIRVPYEGCDPNKAQWDELSALMLEKKHVVFFDSAYQVLTTDFL